VFSKTSGYRHASIETGVRAIARLGRQHGFAVDATEDAVRFSSQELKRYRAVVFLNSTGDVLDAAQQAAFEEYIEGGGGYAGIHSAADTEYDWPWYGRLVGAYFASHPDIQPARLQVLDRSQPATSQLPATWQRTDEWYNFRTAPHDVTVLISIDESSYDGGAHGADHPMAWYHEMGSGRAFYSALGHTEESYDEPLFLAHLLGGIRYAARLID
jgi:type 1 glutamine amidotransferase